ncbi:MAG: FHA domain-containing protein [Ruminococcus sp.]|nr:FHA domain-containing protein [Ruminococcus sp.]
MADIQSTVMYKPLPPQPATLVIIGSHEDPIYSVKLDGNMTVGRRSDVDIRLSSPIVSRVHGQFTWNSSDQCYYYMDCNSLNGTFFNGTIMKKLNERGSRAQRLEDGDILRITRRDPDNPHPDAVMMIYSTSFSVNDKWVRYRIGNDVNTIKIGRSEDSVINIDDPRVSQHHALIERQGNSWYISDTGSTNGVFVNGNPIMDKILLDPRDVIRIVDTTMIFFGDAFIYNITKVRGANLNIDIEEKTVGAIKRKTLLKDIRIDVRSGDMMLILGGAGAGKTTFMKAVLGESKAKGKILLDGQDFYKHYRVLKYKIGIVPQFPSIRDSEKVSDIVLDASKMNLNPELSDAEKSKIIESVKNRYSLNEIWDTYYERISGGQKKRVSIAIATFNNPSLFFLDEPDSGLDYANRRNVMEALKTTADQNKMVMVITHAPNDAAELFTKVMVLAKSKKDKSGHVAFCGTVEDALEFFEVDNLQSIVVRINSESEGGEGRADEFIEKYNLLRGKDNGK